METALFSPSSLFGDASDSSSDEEINDGVNHNFVERNHQFPGMELIIREFSFHQFNANLLWPGTFAFAEWLVQHRAWIEGKHIIELGSGTGALAIFLKKMFQIDITTSDYNDQEIEDNISYNCMINGITPALPHVKHTWGDDFSNVNPIWNLVIASDILLYVKQYPNLIKTISFLLKSYQPKENMLAPHNEQDDVLPDPAFLMSWRRRIGKDDEALFFKGCEEAGLQAKHLGSRVYCIVSRN
ncbi:protein N-terminal and lysine N-methyltransferase EFM7 isoform X1 [Amaranthus tricolor]|uniref:protein N-terminal and lysine N-methyltransferase EFM7 isoform X1 n=1 Tax=Amaranthus tricolor TaxID=29722 RepID=UPI002590360A|nr:protein N-terminal and lysine N-methyltransferase EFM7 isoform X1 [Amaranthus tricolor]